MEVPGDGGRLAKRVHQLVVHVIDLDRGETKPLQSGRRAGLADEPRERVAALTIAEAAEVDSGQHHFAMPLLDPLPDLPQDRVRAAAARCSANERDHAEPAREAAAVLNSNECTHAVEPCVGLNAADRADVSGDEVGRVLGPPRDDGHVPGQTGERALEIGPAPGYVHAPMRSRSA
jgi:hypothetical protein